MPRSNGCIQAIKYMHCFQALRWPSRISMYAHRRRVQDPPSPDGHHFPFLQKDQQGTWNNARTRQDIVRRIRGCALVNCQQPCFGAPRAGEFLYRHWAFRRSHQKALAGQDFSAYKLTGRSVNYTLSAVRNVWEDVRRHQGHVLRRLLPAAYLLATPSAR